MLESTEKGGVRNSIRNCLTVFQNDPLLSGAIAKNLLTERTDIIKLLIIFDIPKGQDVVYFVFPRNYKAGRPSKTDAIEAISSFSTSRHLSYISKWVPSSKIFILTLPFTFEKVSTRPSGGAVSSFRPW